MDLIKKNPALAIGVLYVLGILVTAIHLNRFAISDLDLTKVRYIFAGAVCCYFLALRLVITALILDFRIIRSVSDEARHAVHNNLRDTWAFKIIDRVASLRFVGFFLRKLNSEGISNSIIELLSYAALFFIFGAFYFFLSIPSSPISTSEILRAAWRHFPSCLVALFVVQLAYLAYFYFKRAMQSTEQLKNLWKVVFALLLLTDIGVYSFMFHPLVKPVFGGGVVSIVNLMPKDQASLALIKQTTGIKFTVNKSEAVYIVHSSDSAYYLTKQYELNYLSPKLSDMIIHERIYRVQKELISGYEIIGFK